jgi:hypothetical protein
MQSEGGGGGLDKGTTLNLKGFIKKIRPTPFTWSMQKNNNVSFCFK